MTKTSRIVVSCSLLLAACAGSASTDPGAGTNAAAVQAHEAAQPIPDITGTWAFVLDRSDPAAALRDRCNAQSGGDGAKAVTCYREICDEAAREKIRFTKTPAGKVIYRSFGDEGGKEVVFTELELELTSDGPNRVVASAGGQSGMRIELADDRTLVLEDTKKGRLVFDRE